MAGGPRIPAVTVLAPAKINLGLEVLYKRRDGYHQVITLLQALRLTDRVDLALSREPGIRLRVIPAGLDLGPEEDNLAIRAARLIPALPGPYPGCEIVLTKRIPAGAGLGGGSADAAAVLVGLNHLRGGQRSPAALEELGATLGSDVPFLVRGGTQLATGRGEILHPAPSWPVPVLALVFPNLSISTTSIYSGSRFGLTTPGPLANIPNCGFPRDFWVRHGHELRNDLEPAVLCAEPRVSSILKDFGSLGSTFVRVSGSGSAVYGLAADGEKAEAWSRHFRELGYWSKAVRPSRGGCVIRKK